MSAAKKPSPQGVSAFMAKEFFRSESHSTSVRGYRRYTSGFTVRTGLGLPGQVEHVAVEHVVGNFPLGPEARRRSQREHLEKYREHLEQRYRVTTNEDDDGYWDTLLVWSKDSD